MSDQPDSPRDETPSGFSVDTLLDAAAARIESLERRLQEAQRDLEIVQFQRQRDVLSRHDALDKMVALKAERDAALRELAEERENKK